MHSQPPQPAFSHRQGALYRFVCDHLFQHWSPQQIAGHLKKLHTPRQARESVTREHLHPHLRSTPGASSRRSWCPVCAWPTPALAPLQGQGPAWGNPGLAEHPCAPTRNRGPSASRPLGGRPHQGANNASAIGTSGRAHHAPGAAGQVASSQSSDSRACAAGVQRQAQRNSKPYAPEPDLRQGQGWPSTPGSPRTRV